MTQKCKRLLLYTACPDALIRLQKAALKDDQKELCHIYFSEQHHSSFQDFMRAHASAHSSNNYFQVSDVNKPLVIWYYHYFAAFLLDYYIQPSSIQTRGRRVGRSS